MSSVIRTGCNTKLYIRKRVGYWDSAPPSTATSELDDVAESRRGSVCAQGELVSGGGEVAGRSRGRELGEVHANVVKARELCRGSVSRCLSPGVAAR